VDGVRDTVNLSDNIIAAIRTYTPALVGLAVGWLIAQGLPVSPGVQDGLTAVISAAAIAGYYAGVRALEARWPAFGWLLGVAKTPAYGTEDKAVNVPVTGHQQVKPLDSTSPPTRPGAQS